MRKYPDLPPNTVALEEEVLGRWQAEDTFRRSLEQTADGEPFVFYEGPPTANGRPGIHHVFSRTIKDSVSRFRTMQGRWVPRMAGWDTHGLPVEIEAEKKLGISGKREIEAIGIARFNEVCRESVLTYTGEWERFSARIGYWLDYSRPYVTYREEYVESVWWLLKRIADRGLFYRGHKILPYCPRCGTGLSSHEVAQGYKDVKDPSLYVILPLVGDDGEADGRELLVWTTTPWTLVSNTALAVNPELEYAEVEHEGRRLVLARARVAALFGSEEAVTRTFPASEIVGAKYRRPFDWVDPRQYGTAEQASRAWHVYAADFVTSEDGTGIVHTAPAFGADDYALGQAQGLPVLHPVDDRGAFRADLPLVGGRFVKDADTDLVIELKKRGQVFKSSKEEHSYPHCWRCGSPLLYMARDSWFIRTTAVREDLLANNAQIRWFPPEMGSGRFGEWLENNVDWAISRNRYWGTPLPAWVCDADLSHTRFVGSFDELRELSGLAELPDPHRPYVDEVTLRCTHEGCGGTMRRVPEVIDVWFDSGAMPYAQHHFPWGEGDNREFRRQYPADFICEAVDQTRGWFYSLLAISTLVGGGVAEMLGGEKYRRPAFLNVVVNDMILDAEGLKMSKSKGNVVNPFDAIAQFGADAIRWYLVTSSHPWIPKRFDPEGVREVQRKTFDTLRQTYRFFALYANAEGWTPGGEVPAPERRNVLDRWLLSRLASVTAEVTADLDQYNLTHATRTVAELVVDDLSNWYVRRSRDRFWGSADAADTRAAFATLHEALVTVVRLMAPIAPFLSDWLHRALCDDASVHLAAYPAPDASRVDPALERGMAAVRTLSTLGRAAREAVGVKVRQPLGTVYAVIPHGIEVTEEELDILRDELNVHAVEFMDRAEELVTYSAKPDFKSIGKVHGKNTQAAAEAIRKLTSDQIAAFRRREDVTIEVAGTTWPLAENDFEIIQTAQGDFAVQAEGGFTVALDAAVTPELRLEGLAREVVNRVQNLRKESGLEVTDRIRLGVFGDGEILDVMARWKDFVARETLAVEVEVGSATDFHGYDVDREVDLDGVPATIALAKAA
jgi:isoleucyl-tRNA synthetase